MRFYIPTNCLIAGVLCLLAWINPPQYFPGGDSADTSVDGLHAAIIEETSERSKLPLAQLNILRSTAIPAYAATHCAKEPDGKTPTFRQLDKDTDVSNDSPWVKEFMAVKRDSVPWLIVQKGKKRSSGPLPADEAATLELLKKYGGN